MKMLKSDSRPTVIVYSEPSAKTSHTVATKKTTIRFFSLNNRSELLPVLRYKSIHMLRVGLTSLDPSLDATT
jgi:hypothetical protein